MTEYNGSLFKLWQSAIELSKRFRGESERPSRLTSTRLIREELNGVSDALKTGPLEDVVEEVVDVIITCMGLIYSEEQAYTMFETAITKVIEKNNAKTQETHYLDPFTGKIRKRLGVE